MKHKQDNSNAWKKIGLAALFITLVFGGVLFLEEGITGLASAPGLKWTTVDKCEKANDPTSSEFIFGEVTSVKKGKTTKYTDVCSKDKKKVTEYYCDRGKRIARKQIDCNNGCQEGMCITNLQSKPNDKETCYTACEYTIEGDFGKKKININLGEEKTAEEISFPSPDFFASPHLSLGFVGTEVATDQKVICKTINYVGTEYLLEKGHSFYLASAESENQSAKNGAWQQITVKDIKDLNGDGTEECTIVINNKNKTPLSLSKEKHISEVWPEINFPYSEVPAFFDITESKSLTGQPKINLNSGQCFAEFHSTVGFSSSSSIKFISTIVTNKGENVFTTSYPYLKQTDNILTKKYTLSKVQPVNPCTDGVDLKLVYVPYDYFYTQSNLSISFKVVNNGRNKVAKKFWNEIQICNPETDACYLHESSIEENSFDSGAVKDYYITIELNKIDKAYIANGEIKVRMIVDGDYQITESDETNNLLELVLPAITSTD